MHTMRAFVLRSCLQCVQWVHSRACVHAYNECIPRCIQCVMRTMLTCIHVYMCTGIQIHMFQYRNFLTVVPARELLYRRHRCSIDSIQDTVEDTAVPLIPLKTPLFHFINSSLQQFHHYVYMHTMRAFVLRSCLQCVHMSTFACMRTCLQCMHQ